VTATEGGTVTTATETATRTYRIHIKATPEEIWDALMKRTEEYGYRSAVEYDLEAGTYKGLANAEMRQYGMPEVIIDGEILEADLPHRLVQTWNPFFDDEKIAAESPARLTWEVEEWPNGVSRLTLTSETEEAPLTVGITSGDVAEAMGGWPFVLSDLKTLLETGKSLAG
jgi:uncharacterized protein YndB with AHSA1/START domain